MGQQQANHPHILRILPNANQDNRQMSKKTHNSQKTLDKNNPPYRKMK
jgi:hypothetical protein